MSSPKRPAILYGEPLTAALRSEAGALSVRLSKHSHSRSSHFELETEFGVAPGVTVIVGHSGAGKTTILRCIAGLSDPEEGNITIGDRVLFDSKQRIKVEPARRRVAFVFQDLALFPHLSVQDNVTYGLRRLDRAEQQRRMREILESFRIAHLCHRLPRQISGGEQQRVALARSLVTEPSVLLLDEPLSSLDPRTKASIIEDLRRWNDARRIPILYVTHDHAEVLDLGDRVIALEQGRIVAEGLPSEVLPALRPETAAHPAGFENVFDATVVEHREQDGAVVCQLTGTSIRIETPLAQVPLGSEVRIGIRAAEILVTSSQPSVASACNVMRGSIKSLQRAGSAIEARVGSAVGAGSGAEFRVHLPPRSVESLDLNVSSDVWMIIGIHASHLVRPQLFGRLQRLFVFVCGGNTSRSPMAQAVCNAEIARRLGVPLESMDTLGIRAISAGVSAHPGEPMAEEAEQALEAIGVPGFEHRSGNMTRRLARKAEVIFCMTEDQRNQLIAAFPEAASKIHCLHPERDIDDPTGKGAAAFSNLVSLLQHLVAQRLEDLGLAETAL